MATETTLPIMALQRQDAYTEPKEKGVGSVRFSSNLRVSALSLCSLHGDAWRHWMDPMDGTWIPAELRPDSTHSARLTQVLGGYIGNCRYPSWGQCVKNLKDIKWTVGRLLEPQLERRAGGHWRATARGQIEEHCQNQRSGARMATPGVS